MAAETEEISEWLAKADEDFRVAEILLKTGEELTLPCMFHLQQMLEKLLKASILKQGRKIERTHDLSRLTELSNNQEISGLLDVCDMLNVFAVNGRYPGDLPQVSIAFARNYFEQLVEVRDVLLQQIKG